MFPRPVKGKTVLVVLVLAPLAVALLSCAGTKELVPTSAEAQFERGKRRYDSRRFLDATDEFKLLLAQYPGSRYAEPAIFFLGKSYFETKEYPLAEVEFARVVRDFPRGEHAEEATFMLGMCAFKQKRSAHYDQTQTEKAIRLFNAYLAAYPDGAFATEAEQRLEECREVLARKLYLAGELYRKLGDPRAARISFQEVLDDYGETSWADWALVGIGQTFEKEGNWKGAIEAYQRALDRGGDGEVLDAARQALKRARDKVDS